jgi:hypothetical protein
VNTSDTPETDHLEDQLGSAAKFSHPIIWRHARKLERERDELAALLAAEKSTRTSIIEKGVKTERERNEAREKYDTLAVENMLEVNKLCKERDEAREQVDRYRDKLDLLPISWEL